MQRKIRKVFLFFMLMTVLWILSMQVTYVRENNYLDHIDQKHAAVLFTWLSILLICVLYKICKKLTGIPAKYNSRIILFFLLLLFLVQLAYIFVLQPQLRYDPFSVAYDAKKGIKSLGYYATFPYQIKITMLISWFYKIVGIFGITDLFTADAVLAAMLMDISIYYSYKIAEILLMDSKKARVVFVLAMLCPSVYLWGTYLYTHIVSLTFMTISIYIILVLRRMEDKQKVVMYSAFLALTSYIALSVRYTGFFPVIALSVCCAADIGFLKRKDMSILYYAAPALCVYVLSYAGMELLQQSFIRGQGFQTFDAYDTALPWTYFFLLGVAAGTGFDCLSYMSSLSTHQDKISGALAQAAEMIRNKNLQETFDWIALKLKTIWGIGDSFGWYGFNSYRNFEGGGKLQNIITGDRAGYFVIYSQILLIAMFVFIFCLLVHLWIKADDSPELIFILVIFAGAMVYQILFESQPSYSFTWITILFILAVSGFEKLTADIEKVSGFLEKKQELFKKAGFLFVCVMIFVTAWFGLYFDFVFTVQNVENTRYVVNMTEADSSIQGELRQSFRTRRDFNTITLNVSPVITDQMDLQYELLLENEEGSIIAQQLFHIHELEADILIFQFDMISPEHENTYYVICRPVNADALNYIAFPYFNENVCDLYQRGTLQVDGTAVQGDAQFCVKSVTQKPYASKVVYYLVVAVLILLQIRIYRDLTHGFEKRKQIQMKRRDFY